MAGRIVRLVAVCASAALLAGCLSIHVDKTEKSSSKAASPVGTGLQASIAEPAE